MVRDVDSNGGGAAVATKETASGAVALAGRRSIQQRRGSIGDIDSYGGGGGGGGGNCSAYRWAAIEVLVSGVAALATSIATAAAAAAAEVTAPYTQSTRHAKRCRRRQ